MRTSKNGYWFTIEPYVYANIVGQKVLLYNTLDGKFIEYDNRKISNLLSEVLRKDSNGVVYLSNDDYGDDEIRMFVDKLRDTYMGDIIEVDLSKGKPIQVLPYFDLQDREELYRKINFFPYEDVLENLFEVTIYLGDGVNVDLLINFLHVTPQTTKFNVRGNLGNKDDYMLLMSFFNQRDSSKYIYCDYIDIALLNNQFDNNFTYIVSVCFPVDEKSLEYSIKLLLQQTLPFEYVFFVSSANELENVKRIVEKYKIQFCQLSPVYTGENISFFEDNIYLTKEDIFSEIISVKDIFIHQSMNIYEYGKISIMPNGDVFANLQNSKLGNICTDSILSMLHKELREGKSWFHLRTEYPCSECLYQWLCPSPSNCELTIGRPNLCHIKNSN